jgi:hypothetical protein
MRLRVVGIEAFTLRIDDDVTGPIRIRVEQIDSVCGDHELPAEQEARRGAEDKADESMGHCLISARSVHAHLHMRIQFCIMYNLRGAMWTVEHRGSSAALQHPMNAIADGADGVWRHLESWTCYRRLQTVPLWRGGWRG